ncbi:MAG: DegT/DnrJ/EryC1/StrS family aminotransferase [Bacteroidetes bacterium]|nr:DegT/DnrJ/EryC1/StrS family aminotransferase [Bacteroidota bacterium]
MSKLAMNGGSKLADRTFPTWSVHDDEDEKNLLNVFRRNKWWMYAFGTDELAPGETAQEISQVEQFEQEFAKAQLVKHCLTINSGSSALEVALETTAGRTAWTALKSVSCIRRLSVTRSGTAASEESSQGRSSLCPRHCRYLA